MDFNFKSINDVQASNSNAGGGNYGKFGMNTAKLEKFEYVDTNGSEALQLTFKVGDADYNHRIFPAKVFDQSLSPGTEEYNKALSRSQEQMQVAVSQVVEAIVNKEVIVNALNAAKPTTFKEYIQVMERLVKNTANWNTKELDLFLNWQRTPGANQNKTFLEVPRQLILNFRNSIFVTAKQPGTWTEDRGGDKLTYKNERGETHPIQRDAWFMKQNYAKRVDLEKDNAPETGGNNPQEEKVDW